MQAKIEAERESKEKVTRSLNLPPILSSCHGYWDITGILVLSSAILFVHTATITTHPVIPLTPLLQPLLSPSFPDPLADFPSHPLSLIHSLTFPFSYSWINTT